MPHSGIDWLARAPATPVPATEAPQAGEPGAVEPRAMGSVVRLAARILATLGALAASSAALVLLMQASGLATGAIPDVLVLATCGLLCFALAAVAHGLAGAAERTARQDAALITCHARSGDVLAVEHAGGPFAFAAGAGEDLTGPHLVERILVADRPAFLAAVAAAARGPLPMVCDVRLRASAFGEAQPRYVALQARALPAGAGIARVVFREASILERKAAQEARAEEAQARAEAERANAAKTRFLAAMSHELRTPLNAILGFSELLATDAAGALDEDRKKEYARIIHDSGQHLLGLVNDILDLSRVEAGAYDLTPEPIDVAALLAGCREMMALRAQQAGVAIDLRTATGLPQLAADRRAVRQMVLNLLANAVKFSPPGSRVEVRARIRRGSLSISVRDSGPGMSEQDVARLGEPFFQAGDATQKAQGSGLGLAVVKGLVALHHGTFDVASTLGRGTRVTLALPLAPPSAAPAMCDQVVSPFPREGSGASESRDGSPASEALSLPPRTSRRSA